MLTVFAWRFIQNILGEVVVLFSIGDDWNGEESVLSVIFQVACGLVNGILVADLGGGRGDHRFSLSSGKQANGTPSYLW